MSGERELRFRDGPFLGLYERSELDVPPGFLSKCQNCYTANGMVLGRPGTGQLGDEMESGAEKVQGPFYFEEFDGTGHTVCFCNGAMYELDWVGETWDAISFGVSGVVVDPDATVRVIQFQEILVVTDRVNQPWTWDGTTFTVLANAPIAGHVTFYFAKIFFSDLPTQENTFMWSDEFDPANGYDAGGSDNVWDFSGVDPGRVLALTGTQEALIVWKEDSITRVEGAVEENFATEANRASISNTFGLVAPGSIIQLERDIYFLSQEGPKRIRGAYSAPEDIGRNYIAKSWDRVNDLAWEACEGGYDPLRRHLLWFCPTATAALNHLIAFSPFPDEITNRPDQGFWVGSGLTVTGVSVVKDDLGRQRVLFGMDAGLVFEYGASGAYDDDGVATFREAEGRAWGRDIEGWKHIDRADFHFRSVTQITASMTPLYDDEAGVQQQFTIGTNSGPLWNVALWNVAKWGGSIAKAFYSRGLNGECHGFRWRLTQEEVGQTLALERVVTFATTSDVMSEVMV